MCAAVNHKATVEPRGSYADSNKRPDVRLSNYHAFGSHLDIDVGTISTASEQVYETAAVLPGFAADKVEKEKHARWDDIAKAEGNTIVVIAYELGGRFGGEALKFFDTIAREWRCKWSEDGDKASLASAQKVLEKYLPQMKARGSVQRTVCGGCLDFKVNTSMGAEDFGAWEADGFAPESEFLAELGAIDGITSVETQTFTLMPM